MKKFLFDCGVRDPLASAGLLVLRVSFGLMMLFGHGLMKWQNYSELVKSWKVVPQIWPLSYLSEPMSLMATIGAEVFAAALIALGLMTRPAAFVLGFAMCVAAFQVHGAAPLFSMSGPSKEMALLYLAPAFVLIITGAGKWSLDAAILGDKRRRRR
ncbi:DoxX family protein [Luteolibacter marinus]|uniref:DoxX family protein n=1 Tax=Luteolibacter marinus TaxID=2776705 RepID=UPI001865CC52|nr:DoxX family protein [Luteolibacter marinus]